MKFNTFHPTLWFLLLCILTTRGQRGETRITAEFHKSDQTVYAFSPLRIECSGKPGPGGSVYFKLTGRSAYNDSLVAYKLQDNNITTYNKTVRSVARPLPAGYFKNPEDKERVGMEVVFCVPKSLLGLGHLVCLAYSSEGERTATNVIYIHTQFGPSFPIVKAYYHLPERQLIYGETLRITCSAYVGAGGRLMFWYEYQGEEYHWTIYYDLSRSPVVERCYRCYVPKATINYFRQTTSRGPRIDARFERQVNYAFNESSIFCFATNTGNSFQKGRSAKTGTVVDIPYKPVLRVKSFVSFLGVHSRELWYIEGFCNTSSDNAGMITVIVRTSRNTHIFTNIAGGQTYQTSAWALDNVETIDIQKVQDVRGQTKTLSMKILVGLKLNSQPVTLSCKVKDLLVCDYFKPPMPRNRPSKEEDKDYSSSVEFESVLMAAVITFSPFAIGLIGLLVLVLLRKQEDEEN